MYVCICMFMYIYIYSISDKLINVWRYIRNKIKLSIIS